MATVNLNRSRAAGAILFRKETVATEHLLHTTVRALVGEMPLDAAIRLMLRRNDDLGPVSSSQRNRLQAILNRAVTQWLVSEGWQSRRCLCASTTGSGRFWSRHHPEHIRLTFGPATGRLILWCATENVCDPQNTLTRSTASVVETSAGREPVAEPVQRTADEPLSLGDQLVWLMAVLRFRESQVGRSLASIGQPAEQLVAQWIAPEATAAETWTDEAGTWFGERRIWVLEALADAVAEAWVRLERSKWETPRIAERLSYGRLQRRILNSWVMTAIDRKRPDLLTPLLPAVGSCLDFAERAGEGRALAFRSGSPAVVREAVQLGLVTGELLQQFAELTDTYRQIGYFDDDYSAAQLWLSAWERCPAERYQQRYETLQRAIVGSLGTRAEVQAESRTN